MTTTQTVWEQLSPRERDCLVGETFGGFGADLLAMYRQMHAEQAAAGAAPDASVYPYDDIPAEQTESGEAWRGWLPRYTGDLSTAALVEEEVERRRLHGAYLIALFGVLGIYGDPEPLGTRSLWMLVHATPDQRCHAALRAVGVAV